MEFENVMMNFNYSCNKFNYCCFPKIDDVTVKEKIIATISSFTAEINQKWRKKLSNVFRNIVLPFKIQKMKMAFKCLTYDKTRTKGEIIGGI